MVKNSLLLIQTTESDNHRDTQFRHIEMILNCARKKNPKVQLLLVYSAHTLVVKGGSEDLHLKY